MVSVKIENIHQGPIKKMSLRNGPTPTIVGNIEEKNADFFWLLLNNVYIIVP
jgi:hypothetical protein